MTIIKAQEILLVKYATYKKPINYDYSSPDSNFKLVDKEYDTEDPNLLKSGQLLVQTLYLSNDPAQKGWFSPYKSYHATTPLNTPAPSHGIARVIKSNAENFKEGNIIKCQPHWTTHRIIDVDPSVIVVDPTKVPSLSLYLSAFGGTAITAYLAAFKYSGVKPEDEGKVWLVSGAAGGVGSFLVQILAKLYKPKKILAIAGGPEKVKYVESIGPKVIGIDYRSKTYDEDFEKALDGDEIDIFVDQVSGEILNKAMNYMATHSKILQCGAISRYNNGLEVFDFSNYNRVITHRITIQGFVIVDDYKDFPSIISHLLKEFQLGNLDISKVGETVVDAKGKDFKNVPELWTGLFNGKNTGKYITRIADYKL